jgi:hypothetical protein
MQPSIVVYMSRLLLMVGVELFQQSIVKSVTPSWLRTSHRRRSMKPTALNSIKTPTNITHMIWLGAGELVFLIGVNASLGLALYHTQQALTQIKLREAYTFEENTNVLHELQQCEEKWWWIEKKFISGSSRGRWGKLYLQRHCNR